MLIVLDPHSGVPMYRQLMDQIKFHVTSGLLRPGEELPSTRALSADLGLNPMTVSKAYGLLEREGVVARRPGLPLVVPERAARTQEAERMEQLKQSLASTVVVVRQLGIPPEEALRAFRDLLEEPEGNGFPGGTPDESGDGRDVEASS